MCVRACMCACVYVCACMHVVRDHGGQNETHEVLC